jgi:hypothetical protein
MIGEKNRVLTDKTHIRDLFQSSEAIDDVYEDAVQLEFAFKY